MRNALLAIRASDVFLGQIDDVYSVQHMYTRYLHNMKYTEEYAVLLESVY